MTPKNFVAVLGASVVLQQRTLVYPQIPIRSAIIQLSLLAIGRKRNYYSQL